MDISGIFGKKDNTLSATDSDSNIGDSPESENKDAQNVVMGDPLANVDDLEMPDNTGEIIPNETVSTNDQSTVGEFKVAERPQPVQPLDNMIGFAVPSAAAKAVEEAKSAEVENLAQNAAEDLETIQNQTSSNDNQSNVKNPETTIISEAVPEDPAKLDFIKTYTQEFDDALRRATDIAQKILDSIDAAVHDHSPDIAIPDEAKEFLDDMPEDGKVQKFDDARVIVREVMQKASEAKQQSQEAAAEAAQVYDDVQNFKRETKQQIKNLRGEDMNK